MRSNYLIVVGIDGSQGGKRALRWAAREAASRGGAVQAVIAWSWDGMEYGPLAATRPQEEAERAARLLDQEIKEVVAVNGSSLPVAGEVIEGRPADVLSAAGRTADLLVLGSHGHSRVRHTVLGSVSEECVRKGTCPVVIVPVPAAQPAANREPVPRT